MHKILGQNDMKVCIICGCGGHLTEILKLESVYRQYDYFLVTSKATVSEGLMGRYKTYFIKIPYRRIRNLGINIIQSLKIFLVEKPDVIITTGAGIALAMCYIARLLYRKIIYIECSAQVTIPSLFGRLVHPIADLIIVQWRNMLKYYKNASYGKLVFDFSDIYHSLNESKVKEQIFVTVGTTQENFDRLLKEVDRLVQKGTITECVVAQIGYTQYEPKNYKFFRFNSIEEFLSLIEESKIIITHGGIGTIANCLNRRKPTIVVPRLRKFGEHANNHQLQITTALARDGKIIPIFDIEHLEKGLEKAKYFNFSVEDSKEDPKAIEILDEYLKMVRT